MYPECEGIFTLPCADQPSHRASPRNTTDASTGGPPLAVWPAPCRSHLSARPRTAAANRKRSPSTRSSPGIWNPFSSTPERPITDCRSTSRRRCAPTSNAAFWPTDSCAPVVRTAGRAGRLPFPARSAGSAPPAAAGAWPIRRRAWVDDVLPRVPVRQWVLSFPYEIRYRLAYDGEWVSKVLAVFLRVVGGWYRRQAQAMGHGNARWGSVTFVQRFGSSLNLNPHVHVLMLDGVYVDGEEAPVFVAAPPLSDSGRAADRADECAPHHPLVHETRPARRHRRRSARRRGARARRPDGGLGAGDRRHRGTGRPAPATRPARSGHRGAYGALVLCLARLFPACGDADRGS